MIFSVWAPVAKSVELILGEQRIAMAPKGGNWQIELRDPDLSAGYRYSIDSGAPLPDPRSPWQPSGVHGASHVIDASALKDGALGSEFREDPARSQHRRHASDERYKHHNDLQRKPEHV